MPVRSAVVGAEAAPYVVELTPRAAMAYAAGVGETNPRYFDDAAQDGILAPPALCTALEWKALAGIRQLEAVGLSLDEARRGVHATQDSSFHRPMRPGDRLSCTARIVAVRRIAPGALMVVRFGTVEEGSGEPVVTTFAGFIYRGVEVDGDDAVLEQSPPLPEAGVADPRTSVAIPIGPGAAHVYTECADIWNPIHTERRVALAAGLPDIILHGTATWALAARELVSRCAKGDPSRLLRLAGRFSAMIVPGSSISLEYADAAPVVPFEVSNAGGDPAIAEGRAVIGGSSRAVIGGSSRAVIGGSSRAVIGGSSV
jgi:acyl dehydratase